MDEFGRHVQIVVTDNQPEAEKTQQGVAGKCLWLVNDLGAKRDLLKAGLGWGHMPRHLVGEDLASGELVARYERAPYLFSAPAVRAILRRRPAVFMPRSTSGRPDERPAMDYQGSVSPR